MSDYIATEVRPVKNAFGLPTGDGGFTTEPLESDANEEAPQEGLEVEVEEAPVEAVEEEGSIPEEAVGDGEEDILRYLEEEPDEPVSEESEMDRLRTKLAILEDRLERQATDLDRGIKEEAVEVQEEDDELDFTNPQFRAAIGEKLQEDPSLVPVLLQEMVDRKLKAYSQRLEAQEAKQTEAAVNIEQQNRLKESFAKGLESAVELGETEKRIVEQVAEAVAHRDPSRSILLKELEKHPELANSPEGIEATVVRLAKKAELRARSKGVDISSPTKPTASDRSNRMLNKQTQPSEEGDYAEEKFKQLLATRKGNLDALLRGK